MGADNLTVMTSKELDALLSLRASANVKLGIELALNGMPNEFHSLTHWFKEMGIDNSKVAQRMIATARSKAITTALQSAPLLERLLLSAEVQTSVDP